MQFIANVTMCQDFDWTILLYCITISGMPVSELVSSVPVIEIALVTCCVKDYFISHTVYQSDNMLTSFKS